MIMPYMLGRNTPRALHKMYHSIVPVDCFYGGAAICSLWTGRQEGQQRLGSYAIIKVSMSNQVQFVNRAPATEKMVPPTSCRLIERATDQSNKLLVLDIGPRLHEKQFSKRYKLDTARLTTARFAHWGINPLGGLALIERTRNGLI